ncbi:MAG: M23 family metallopeptidase [Rhodothermales bacterium]|nr:M23 family metallopeptidase [Rhodothermales bacterium]
MANKRTYYFDEDSCEFREVRESASGRSLQLFSVVFAVILLSAGLTLGLDQLLKTPQELALLEENRALQEQLTHVGKRIEEVSGELSQLKETDETLYRTLLNAQGISDEVRQVGVGGSEQYPEYDRFTPSTGRLLTQTSMSLDQLERQLAVQTDSYRELTRLADQHADALSHMPAIFPVDGRITSGFGRRFHPVLKVERMHYGLDFHAPVGTPVYATGDGVIEQTGRGSGLGRYVRIKHGDTGYVTVFGHLSEVPREVRRGRRVKRGDLIGYSGNTGLSNAPHLHYEVRDSEDRSLNPIYFVAPSMTPSEYERLLAEAANTTYIFD